MAGILSPDRCSGICAGKAKDVATNGKVGKLVLVGFFGRGNAGDEAMLQCIYEAFSPRYHIVITVDQHGARPGYWDWYPYNETKFIHQMDIGHLDGMGDCVGLLAGGGGIATGYAANWAIAARGKGIPTALAGVEIWEPEEASSPMFKAMQTWLGIWDLVVPRTKASFDRAVRLGANTLYGGDWALNLMQDQAPDVECDPKRAVVVIREADPRRLQPTYRGEFEAVLSGLSAMGWNPILLPFSPEDEAFAKDMELSRRFPSMVFWWNARRLKQMIANSGLLVSYGRLHPMIFAATTGCPTATVVPTGIPMMKLREVGADLGVDVHEGPASFLTDLRAGKTHPADPERVNVTRERVAHSLDALNGLFRRR
jgi:polysaccharide pyruvyl transferase WcaK-like protein